MHKYKVFSFSILGRERNHKLKGQCNEKSSKAKLSVLQGQGRQLHCGEPASALGRCPSLRGSGFVKGNLPLSETTEIDHLKKKAEGNSILV